MRYIALDFETYYCRVKKYSLKNMTTREYIMHSLFEALILCMEDIHTGEKWHAVGDRAIRQLLSTFDWSNITAVAHNMYFDGAILAWRFGVHPARLMCTWALSIPVVGVSVGNKLEVLAQYFGLPAKGTAVYAADGKRLVDMTPQEVSDYLAYCAHDTYLCARLAVIFMQYIPPRELIVLDATIRMYTVPVLRMEEKSVHEHIKFIEQRAEQLLIKAQDVLYRIGIIEPAKKVLASTPKMVEALKALGAEIPLKPNAKGVMIPALAKTDAGLELLLQEGDEDVQALVEARLETKSTLEITRSLRFLSLLALGPLPFPLYYYGAAQTGRWSAWDSINMQNLPRKSPLRGGLAAPPGYVIVDADLSQIELRIGLRIAGEFALLRLLAEGKDLYRISAAEAFNKAVDAVTDDERQMGKVTELSAIFGVGAANLRQQFRTKGKLNVSLEDSQYMIGTYRSSHVGVKAAWGEGNMIIRMILQRVNGPVWGGLCQVVDGVLIKPSGLPIRFENLREHYTDEGERVYLYDKRVGNKNVTTKLYGAKVYQNAVQSIARDFFAEPIARLSLIKNSWPYLQPVGLVHDDILGIAPEEYGLAAAKLLNAALTTANPHIPDVPLACEVKLGATYGTAKKLPLAELELFKS